jgi:hypothetical protein
MVIAADPFSMRCGLGSPAAADPVHAVGTGPMGHAIF